jgi:hypothetical protein
MVNIFLKRVFRNDKVTHQIKNMVLRFMGGGILACPMQARRQERQYGKWRRMSTGFPNLAWRLFFSSMGVCG